MIVGSAGPDPAVVGDVAAVGPLGQRDVEVGPDQDAAAGDTLEVVECVEGASPRSERGADEVDQVDETVGVAPLVVVPADDLDLVADAPWSAGVEDARRRVGDDVGGDDRVLGVGEVALERAVGGRLDTRR